MADAEQIKKLLADEQALKEIATDAFKAVDTDGSGFIDRSELKNLLDSTSDGKWPPITDEELDQACKLLDSNGDGKISLDEFLVLIKAILEGMIA